jgi:hypothetical protein
MKLVSSVHGQVTATQTDDSTTAVAREQLFGHVVSPTMREHEIKEETFSMRSVPELYKEVPRDYDRERLRWQSPAAHTKDRPVLSSERAPHKKQDRNCQTVINIWS